MLTQKLSCHNSVDIKKVYRNNTAGTLPSKITRIYFECLELAYYRNAFSAISVIHIHRGQNAMKRMILIASEEVPVAT